MGAASGRSWLQWPRAFGDNGTNSDMEEEVPYYKDYAFQANATRGVIAAIVLVALFLGYALIDRFVLKSGDGGKTGKLEVKPLPSHYSKETGATIHGVDNPGLEKYE